MNQVYNIISVLHDSSSSIQLNKFNIFNTRGNKFKMQLTHIHFFSIRIVANLLYGTVCLMILFL